MDQVDSMSDAELRAGLLRHGYTVPVTASNRNVLKKKLKQLLTNTERPLRYIVAEPVVEPLKRQSLPKKTNFRLEYQVSVMSDAELRARLLEYGYSVPVTASNRSILKKRLTGLLDDSSQPASMPHYVAQPTAPILQPVLQTTQHFARNPTDSITASQVTSLTNAELRARLKQYGYRNMPITATTRTCLERKLISLLSNKPVNNRQNTDMWSSTRSFITSDYDVNRTTSNLVRVPSNPIAMLHGPANVSDIHNDVTILNKPSTSTGIGVRSSNTSRNMNSIQPPISVLNSLHSDRDTTRTSSLDNIPTLSMDVASTATNNVQKDLISSTDTSATTKNNSEEGLTPLVLLQPTKNIPQSTSKTKSRFVIDFMNRLSALTEEPPKALSCYERKRNCLTPLQEKLLHSPCKIICTNQ